MADILTFRPRRSPTVDRREPRQQLVTLQRAALEEAAHDALDIADRLIAILDQADGDPDLEDGADDEPILGAPEEHSNNMVWFRGTARDLEVLAPMGSAEPAENA